MSDVIERIKQRIIYAYGSGTVSLISTRIEDLIRQEAYSTCLTIIDEEVAKEPEVCEWKEEVDEADYPYHETGCGNRFNFYYESLVSRNADFNICPYCGKKIKVVEE